MNTSSLPATTWECDHGLGELTMARGYRVRERHQVGHQGCAMQDTLSPQKPDPTTDIRLGSLNLSNLHETEPWPTHGALTGHLSPKPRISWPSASSSSTVDHHNSAPNGLEHKDSLVCLSMS